MRSASPCRAAVAKNCVWNSYTPLEAHAYESFPVPSDFFFAGVVVVPTIEDFYTADTPPVSAICVVSTCADISDIPSQGGSRSLVAAPAEISSQLALAQVRFLFYYG
jgi:hypothetical protein